MKIIFLILCSILFFKTFGQKTDKIYLSEIFEMAIREENGKEIVISNKQILTSNLKYRYLFEFLEFNYEKEGLVSENGQININTALTFRNCDFETVLINRISFNQRISFRDCLFNGGIDFDQSSFSETVFEDCRMKDLRINQSIFNDYLITEWNTIENIMIKSSDFNGITKLVNFLDNSVLIENSNFYPQPFPCTIESDSAGYGRKIHDNLQLSIGNLGNQILPLIRITNSNFYSNESPNKVSLQADLNQLHMENNFFRSSLDLSNTTIEKRLIIRNNDFLAYVGFNDVIFSELFNIIGWEQFEGFKLCIYEKLPEEIQYECPPNYGKFRRISDLYSILYLADNQEEMDNRDSYNLLISIYQKLYNIYKSNGDIRSANGCYSEMKNVQSRMLKHNFQEARTFNNFFRWKLAQLLKIYVDHGTDPARAITISVYVIIIFAFFYFLFPSDWDITSKSELLKEFTLFLKKGNQSDFKRFFLVIWGLLLSLLNAITLSLNAFTTLGFGNIPTSGIPRYICILQGFIGWFLLSIFTVALINQVLG